MTPDDIHGLIRQALDLPGDFRLDDGELHIADVPGWDSYGWANIVTVFEEALDVLLPLDELADADRVGQFVAIIATIRAE